MIDSKCLYKLTYVLDCPTGFKASKHIGNPVYFECKHFFNRLFEMSYGDHCFIERRKIFKVVPVRGGI